MRRSPDAPLDPAVARDIHGEAREGQSASAEQRQATIEHASGKAHEALGGRWDRPAAHRFAR
jgi:hypothetical protein